MKVYTKTGDTGQTSIIGEKRDKDDIRIEAYGTVDEALASLGIVLSLKNVPIKVRKDILVVIDKLFDVNRSLASVSSQSGLIEQDIMYLEDAIDFMDKKLVPLKQFILPIGDDKFSQLNMSRTVVRRAERQVIRLSKQESIDVMIIKYLNRLSDFCFVASRYVNYCNNQNESYKDFK